ncbi:MULTISPECIES: hypothetical protein [Chryseobacterium]|jgi:LIVCS family branched-chain amino acid:cation transporter|uniref:hypothetical protein n=1 Tax=Chryseobacterium TaxID=59732 RepID=UPI000830153D|nr:MULTISPECIES: hypothetical protein [Chryseobacterium]AZA58853.1 hypothetical protein EG350_17435 [Chryseobacterium shandongense]
MNEKTIINIGKTLFWLSFGLGNICLFGYIFTQYEFFVNGGFLVLQWGFLINLAAIFILIMYGIIYTSKLDACLNSSAIMLINVPIAIIYIFIGIELVSTNFLR